jgi:hypothetical protein
VLKKKLLIHGMKQLIDLNRVAVSVPEDVWLTSKDGAIRANAKSGLNLFALDLSAPITVETESQVVIDAVDQIALEL